MNSIALKTMAIKARVYNFIRKSLHKKRLEDFNDSQKIQFFDQLFPLNHEAHWELHSYKKKRQRKAAIHKARVERGYRFKKHTSKAQYENSLK